MDPTPDRNIYRDRAAACLCWEGYADGTLPQLFLESSGLRVTGENHISDDAAARRVLAEPGRWDLININTPFVRDVLHPAGLIQELDDLAAGPRLTESLAALSKPLDRFRPAAYSRTGRMIGVPQRFGAFNLVINSNSVSVSTAQQQGFRMALEPSMRGRFGVLGYEDFNVVHFAIAAGLNPFAKFNESELAVFSAAAQQIYRAAHLVTPDHSLLNGALVDGEIDFYVSGGTYTASSARLAGRTEVRAVTPRSGPIDGLGAIAFVEINAIISQGRAPLRHKERFLDFIASVGGSFAAACAGGACNPVVQMSSSSVRRRFTADQLNAMQWCDVEEDLSYCAEYAVMPSYMELAARLRAAAADDLHPQRSSGSSTPVR